MKIKNFATYAKKITNDNKNVGNHCHFTGKYRVVFHNGSTYDYHFIIKELAKEFEEQFECLGENTENYITF